LRKELDKNRIEKEETKKELLEKEKKLRNYISEQELSIKSQKNNIRLTSSQVYGDYGLCQVCNQFNTGDN